jgi:peroxiredoxin
MLRMRFAILTALCAGLFLRAEIPSVPRPAPDFTIQYPGGQTIQLSSYRGKVVALEFLYTTCPHCQHASQVFSKLYTEFGAKGFQPLGVAFNEMSHMLVPDFIKQNNVNYPVGFSGRDPVLSFLGITVVERFVVPQIVWIDRKGMIRAETPPLGEEKQLSEAYWREMIETLTKEPEATTKKPTARHATATK